MNNPPIADSRERHLFNADGSPADHSKPPIFDVEIKIKLPATIDSILDISDKIEYIVGRKKWKEAGWRIGKDIITIPTVTEETASELKRKMDQFKVVEFVKIMEAVDDV